MWPSSFLLLFFVSYLISYRKINVCLCKKKNIEKKKNINERYPLKREFVYSRIRGGEGTHLYKLGGGRVIKRGGIILRSYLTSSFTLQIYVWFQYTNFAPSIASCRRPFIVQIQKIRKGRGFPRWNYFIRFKRNFLISSTIDQFFVFFPFSPFLR